MPKRKSKSQSQHEHATRRASERYGLHFNRHLRHEFVEIIRRRDPKRTIMIDKQTLRVSRFLVEIENRWYPVVYDRMRQTIVTFLPLDFVRSSEFTEHLASAGKRVTIVEEIDRIYLKIEKQDTSISQGVQG